MPDHLRPLLSDEARRYGIRVAQYAAEISLNLAMHGLGPVLKNIKRAGSKSPADSLSALIIGSSTQLAKHRMRPMEYPSLVRKWKGICADIATEIATGDLSDIGKKRTA